MPKTAITSPAPLPTAAPARRPKAIPTDPEARLTVRQLAALLGCHPATVWRWTQAGILPAPRRVRGVTRWVRAEALAAVEAHERGEA